MRIIGSAFTMQRVALQWRREGKKVGFVPTMGYLHAGHLTLVDRARRWVGTKGKVVVSIFVNPTQFGPKEDLAKYPRDLARDRRLCLEHGVDVLFTPTEEQIYPARNLGEYSTYVVEENLSKGMEGSSRPTHFRGVTTIVAKLFNLVLPDVAIFGAKDYQQAAVVKRMVKDLNFPLKIIVASTKREQDGLAMSSRNKYLTPGERDQALVVWNAIRDVRKTVAAAKGSVSATALRKRVGNMIQSAPAARLDYVEFFHPDTLKPVEQVRRGTHMAMAAFVGKTRLIDNGRL